MHEPVQIVSIVIDPRSHYCTIRDSQRRIFKVRLINDDGMPDLSGQCLASIARKHLGSQQFVYLNGAPTKAGWLYLDNINPVVQESVA